MMDREWRGIRFGESPLAADTINELYREFRALILPETPSLVETAGSDYVSTGRLPPGRSVSAKLGMVGLQFFQSQLVMDLIHEFVAGSWRLNDDCSCYINYQGEGDWLGVHRDSKACEVALLVCLASVPTITGKFSSLAVYGSRHWKPQLASGPCALIEDSQLVPSIAGDYVLIEGSTIPHGRPPLLKGQEVTIAAGCFVRKERQRANN